MANQYSIDNFRSDVLDLPTLDFDTLTYEGRRERRQSINELIAKLPKTTKGKPDLSGADLSGLNLAFADLFRANLSGANLDGAILYQAGLQFTNLEGAIMTGADLRGVEALGANLSEADVTGACLDPIDFGESFVYPNFSVANLLRIKGLLAGRQDSEGNTIPSFIQVDSYTKLIEDERPKEGCLDELLILFLFSETLDAAVKQFEESPDTSAIIKCIDTKVEEWSQFFESCRPKQDEPVARIPLGDGLTLVVEAQAFSAWHTNILQKIPCQYGWIQTDLTSGDSYPASYAWRDSIRDQISSSMLALQALKNNRSLG